MTARQRSSGRTRILIVEDDRDMQHLMSVVVEGPGRELLVVPTLKEGLDTLDAHRVSLVILDIILPDGDGRSMLALMRQRRETAVIPVVVVSTRDTQEVRAECFALGADRFIEKPFDPVVLAEDVNVRLERAAVIGRDGPSDDLTDLLNRAGVLEALAGRDRSGAVTLVQAELDGYRMIQEEYGWGTAERFAYEVAQALEEVARPGVALGRVAGGDFAAVVPGEASDGALEMAEAFREGVQALRLKAPDGSPFPLTLSVAVVEDDGSRTPEELLDFGDSLAFRAREAGGNRLVVAGEEEPELGRTVVLAEDDDITATIVTHRLGREGFEIVRFANGAEAYKRALEMTPRLVILDVKMPGMDGFEVLAGLRKASSYARIPIVMLTSMGSEADVVRAFDLGADDYIVKPFSPSKLVARIRRLLSRGQPAPAR